jgi:hypothetical protein
VTTTVSFNLGRLAVNSLVVLTRAIEDTELGDYVSEGELWMKSVVCGELCVNLALPASATLNGEGEPWSELAVRPWDAHALQVLTEVHSTIVGAIKGAAMECLLLIASCAPVDAMEIADRLMHIRCGDATDVIASVCNFSLFMVMYGCAMLAKALCYHVNCTSADGAPDVLSDSVHSMLIEARDYLQEALVHKRPGQFSI